MKQFQGARTLTTMFCLTALLYPSTGMSFQTHTHRLLNERAAQDSPVLDRFLKDQLNFAQGLDTVVNGQSILQWIRIGGAAEDQFFSSEFFGGLFRSSRHFHHPLRAWDQCGLFTGSFECSVRWAQLSNQGFSGKAACGDARSAYFRALTRTTKDERDTEFAETSTILGQLMHLVADLASPALRSAQR